MKKILFLLLPILIIGGCEKDFNTVVNNQSSNYQVTAVSSFKDFSYFPNDSLITLFVKISSFENVSSVYCNIYSSDSKKLNSSDVILYDDGNTASHGDFTADDGTFSNKFPLSRSNPIGNYLVEFFVTGKDEETNKVAEQQFYYDNGQTNVAPVISDLVVADTITVVDTTVSFITVKAADENGLSDIKTVSFISYKPDSTMNGPFYLLDDGGDFSGDQVAGDGIYSIIIKVTPSNLKGTYRFEFQAEDRRGALSNIIKHNVVIK